jgi:GTP-binding protein Era
MTAQARDAFYSASCVGLVIDSARALRDHDRTMFEEACKTGIPIEIILTKTDLVKPRERLLPKIAAIQAWGYQGVVWLVSAHSGRGIEGLYQAILTHTTDTHPEGDCSLNPEQFAAECVREHAFRLLNQEVPYKLYTETNVLREAQDGAIEIHCLIKLEEERHKAIVLGRGGEMIKRIGTRARHDLMRSWGVGVRLFLTVKAISVTQKIT